MPDDGWLEVAKSEGARIRAEVVQLRVELKEHREITRTLIREGRRIRRQCVRQRQMWTLLRERQQIGQTGVTLMGGHGIADNSPEGVSNETMVASVRGVAQRGLVSGR